jgi:acetolactate synthase regulatory subunit
MSRTYLLDLAAQRAPTLLPRVVQTLARRGLCPEALDLRGEGSVVRLRMELRCAAPAVRDIASELESVLEVSSVSMVAAPA